LYDILYFITEVVFVGMTDKQFVAFRRKELARLSQMLELAKQECNSDSVLIKMLEEEIADAKADIEV